MARRLQLDYVRRRGIAYRLGWLALLAGLVCATYLGNCYVEYGKALAGWELRWRGMQGAGGSLRSTSAHDQAHSEQMRAELKMANDVITRLKMPWSALFGEIEASVDEQVTLLSVEPDGGKGTLLITAEAKDLAAMLTYGRRLAESARFQDVYIQNHQMQVQDSQRPVRFVIAAHWLLAPETVTETTP